ncbi:MAG: hypothetical protein UT24_C0044G0002 [Candidatus Woesebacteria bacterium GW2011_GWB1_39_12]|uniref:Uncharacterized protein n=1 Tax=Candidatus Woesebacteria bacterium GW2011_GWB1_39_12 TaxID=1618574 RepID=A0A0G0M340_9BACT|nr:MAG: hypothetical protein UT24_C0044G0002 [Candidatus Woesebacteria bacterium GW2011_GWB1_39_12]
MASKSVGMKLAWMAVCSLAGVVAAFAYIVGQEAKQTITTIGSVGQMADPFVPLVAFWVAILILLYGVIQFFRS